MATVLQYSNTVLDHSVIADINASITGHRSRKKHFQARRCNDEFFCRDLVGLINQWAQFAPLWSLTAAPGKPGSTGGAARHIASGSTMES